MKKNFRKGGGDKSQGSKGKGKSRRDIKNARGLRDVLGMGGGGRSSSGPRVDRPLHGQPATRRDNFSENQRSETKPETPRSAKLTYIMNFHEPKAGAEPSEWPRSQRPESRVPSRHESKPEPQRPNGQARHHENRGRHQQPARGKEAPETGPAHHELHTKKDFRWPKERLKSEPATEDRSARGTQKNAGSLVRGIIKRHPDGFGFLIPDDTTHPDVYISRQSMTGIMTNDRVEVHVYKPKSRGPSKEERLAGEVRRVVTRGHTRIVGKYLPVDQKYGVILDEGRGWGADLRISAKDSMGAQEGDMIAVEVVQYPDENKEFIGRVVSLLGNIDDPLNDVIRIVHQQGIPNEFSATALAEARRFGGVVTEAEKKGREDLTHLPIITIDGATAKDFDDAIWVEQTQAGFKLIVGIADVSHYVKPGTKLDQEAYEKGTSTYFPNFVVPMLPEELSNELCSLKPNVERLSFACEMDLNFNGEVQKYRFFEAVIRSHARVTYGEAQEVIDGSTPPKLKDVADNIKRASDLAKILMQKRFREGSLDLEIPETQVVVDSTGESVDIIRSERLFAHRLIEELMLVTNICTARFLDEAQIPGVFRIHEEPDPDNVRALQRYLWNFGGNKSVMGGNLQKKLSKALQSMEGKPEAQILNILTLRTMRQAHYSQNNVGHFGLGFTHYTHFTSPIRRYPDLIAHRLIKSQIYPRYRTMQMSEDELASATTFLSACEQRSTKAERQVISIKKARFIKRFVGQEFDGIVSSVTKFGVFVLLRQYDVDGLIKLENLGNDRFVFDEENLRLIGSRRGLRYTIGDLVRVRVVAADLNLGKVDFELAEQPKVDDSHVDDEEDFDFVERRSEDRGDDKRMRDSKHGSHENRSQKGKRFDSQKRRSSQDDRGRVRKERFSKRRRKN